MRFFFLPSLVALVLLNLWFPVQPIVYLSHCEKERHDLQAHVLQMEQTALPGTEALEEDYTTAVDEQEVTLQGMEAMAQSMIQRIKRMK